MELNGKEVRGGEKKESWVQTDTKKPEHAQSFLCQYVKHRQLSKRSHLTHTALSTSVDPEFVELRWGECEFHIPLVTQPFYIFQIAQIIEIEALPRPFHSTVRAGDQRSVVD